MRAKETYYAGERHLLCLTLLAGDEVGAHGQLGRVRIHGHRTRAACIAPRLCLRSAQVSKETYYTGKRDLLYVGKSDLLYLCTRGDAIVSVCLVGVSTPRVII
jgi:hypothetical protein